MNTPKTIVIAPDRSVPGVPGLWARHHALRFTCTQELDALGDMYPAPPPSGLPAPASSPAHLPR